MLNIVMTTYNSKNTVGANTRYYFEEILSQHCNLIQLGKGRKHDKRNEETIQKYLDRKEVKPDFVFSNEDTDGYKCGRVIDMHRKPYKRIKSMNALGFNIIFLTYLECPYAYIGDRHGPFKAIDPKLYQKNLNSTVLWTPHSVESSMFYPSNEEPVFDVAFLGDVGKQVYPLRTAIYDGLNEFCATNKYKLLKRNRIPGKVITRKISGIVKQNPTIHYPLLAGKVYAEALRRSRCFIFGSSVFKYPIKKWFEAGASRTLILADTPSGGEALHLEAWVTHIPIDAENWKKRIKWVFDNPKAADKIAQTWYERVMKYHTNQVRVKEFIGQLERFLDDHN